SPHQFAFSPPCTLAMRNGRHELTMVRWLLSIGRKDSAHIEMDWFKCDWRDREGRGLTKWVSRQHGRAVMAKSQVPPFFYRSAPVCAYLTTGDASNLLLVPPVSFAEADHHVVQRCLGAMRQISRSTGSG